MVLLPNLALSLSENGSDPGSDWTRKGDDWHLVIIRARHCSYIVAIAYMDHTIGARGINIQKLKQLQKAILYYKLPYIIFADWNMDPGALRESGFTDQIDGEIKVAQGVTETCISGNILDYLVVSRSFASAIELHIASPRSPWRAHKGFEVDITRSPRAIHILAVLKPKAFNLENLVDPEHRPDWDDCEDESDEADVKAEDNEELNLDADKFAILLEPILSKEILLPAIQLGRSYRSLSRQSEKYLSLSTTGMPGIGGSGSRGDFPKFKRQPLEHWSQANVTGKHTVEARVWCNAENRIIEMIRAKKRQNSEKFQKRIQKGMDFTAKELAKIPKDTYIGDIVEKAYFMYKLTIGITLDMEALKILLIIAHRRTAEAELEHKAAISASVRNWAARAVEGSAKQGHAYLRQADAVVTDAYAEDIIEGHVTIDPDKSVALRKLTWEKYWSRDQDNINELSATLNKLRNEALYSDIDLDIIEDSDVSQHIRMLRNSRGLGFDWWAPAEVKALPPEAHHKWGCSFRQAERLVSVPIQVMINLMGIMKKSTGGERTIALQATWVVIWASMRGIKAKEFDKGRAQFWDSAIAGASALQAGLMRRLIEEVGVLSGLSTLGIYWDMQKFYDSLDLVILIQVVMHHGYSLKLAAIDLQIHVGLRILRWCGSCSSPLAPSTSVLAGGKFSNSYARLYLYDILEELHNDFSSVTLGEHVDDVATLGVGIEDEVLDTMKHLAEQFSDRLKRVKLTISPKTVVTSSSPQLALKLCKFMEQIGITSTAARAARDLGVDAGSGVRRSTLVQKARHTKAKRRTGRLSILQKICSRAKKLYATNIWASSNYGNLAMGVAPLSIRQLRSHAGQAALGRAGQCSTTAIAVAFDKYTDPASKIRVDIVVQWLKLWARSTSSRQEKIQGLWASQLRRLQTTKRWNAVNGPIRAVICTLLDIGWMPVTANAWRGSMNHDIIEGEPLWWKFTGIGDFSELIDAIARSAMDQHWAKASEHMDGQGLAGGADLAVVKKHLRHYQKRGQEDKYKALCVITAGACWPRARKHQADLLPSPACVRCGHASEDTLHFFWQCPGNRDIDDPRIAATDNLATKALQSENKCLWLRGIIPVGLYPTVPPPPVKARTLTTLVAQLS